ncbi:MAG: Hint domain-containing protein [Sulfitobacter sp.]
MKPNTVRRVDGNDRDAGQTSPDIPAIAGLMSGAIILTLDGELPVEFLTSGDRIIARDSGTAIVETVREDIFEIDVVRLSAGSLGRNRPERDVILTAQQPILIRDWRARALFDRDQALVPVQALVDGDYVTDLGKQQVRLFQIRCAAPHVFYADGLELGTADTIALHHSKVSNDEGAGA